MAPEPQPQGFAISPEQFLEWTGALARIETKLDRALVDIEGHEMRLRVVERFKDPTGTFKDHETRLRGLEKWRWYTAGLVFAVGLVATVVGYSGVLHR